MKTTTTMMMTMMMRKKLKLFKKKKTKIRIIRTKNKPKNAVSASKGTKKIRMQETNNRRNSTELSWKRREKKTKEEEKYSKETF